MITLLTVLDNNFQTQSSKQKSVSIHRKLFGWNLAINPFDAVDTISQIILFFEVIA